jgi:hypothetical protein
MAMTNEHPYDKLKASLGTQAEPDSGLVDFFLWEPLNNYANDAPSYHPNSPMLAATLFDMMPAAYQASALATEEERSVPRYPHSKEIHSFSKEGLDQLKAGKTALDQASIFTKFAAKMRALHVIWISIIVVVIIVVAATMLVKNLKNNPNTKAPTTAKKSFLDWETSSFL